MIELQLTDATTSEVMQMLEVPFSTTTLEGAVDVITGMNGINTYYTQNKRSWGHTWAFMDREEYEKLAGFYNRQWSTPYTYPKLTISALGLSNVSVRMYLESKNIIDNCETVQGVTVSFREK